MAEYHLSIGGNARIHFEGSNTKFKGFNHGWNSVLRHQAPAAPVALKVE